MLKIDYSALVPGFGRRSISVPPQEVSRTGSLYHPQVQLTRQQRLDLAWEKQRNHEIARSKILTLPFRQAGYWISRGFKRIRNVFSEQEHIYLYITGRRGPWKLHSDPVWMLEEGKVLDALVKHSSIR